MHSIPASEFDLDRVQSGADGAEFEVRVQPLRHADPAVARGPEGAAATAACAFPPVRKLLGASGSPGSFIKSTPGRRHILC